MKRRLRALLGFLGLIALFACDTSTTPVANTTTSNPFAGAHFYVDPVSNARQTANALTGTRPTDGAQLAKIARQPQADWYGASIPTARIATTINVRTSQIAATGALPVYVIYALPGLDCNPALGLRSAADYHAWIQQFVNGLQTRKAVVILEPDGLAQLECLTPAKQTQRLAMLRDAVAVFGQATRVSVYLDAGNALWHPAALMASRLTAAGVLSIRGFSLNVSNFDATSSEIRYGNQLSAMLAGARFVVDTSRNGLGAYTGALSWCNPPGRALGNRPSSATGDPAADALFWIKAPGKSDGDCGRGEPLAGTWWPAYALGLAERAP